MRAAPMRWARRRGSGTWPRSVTRTSASWAASALMPWAWYTKGGRAGRLGGAPAVLAHGAGDHALEARARAHHAGDGDTGAAPALEGGVVEADGAELAPRRGEGRAHGTRIMDDLLPGQRGPVR